jgi:hypothetical protein
MLGGRKDDTEFDGWYGTLRQTLRHTRRATGYPMATEGSRKIFSEALYEHINNLHKNATREDIAAAYETVVIALSGEVTALDVKLYEHAEMVKRQDTELKRLKDMNRDMGHREMKAHDREHQAIKKTEALLTLIAATTKDPETVDEYGNIITPTGGW